MAPILSLKEFDTIKIYLCLKGINIIIIKESKKKKLKQTIKIFKKANKQKNESAEKKKIEIKKY